MDQKALIRKEFLSRRNKLSADERKKLDELIFTRLTECKEVCEAENIFVYASYRSEVDTFEFMKWCIANNKNIFLPKVLDNNGLMEFYKVVDPCQDLEISHLGIMEPVNMIGAGEEIIPDVIIVPGAVFSRDGDRVGYGGGYYDRYFSRHICDIKLGLCYDFQLSEGVIPTDSHDVKMDIIITNEEQLYRI